MIIQYVVVDDSGKSCAGSFVGVYWRVPYLPDEIMDAISDSVGILCCSVCYCVEHALIYVCMKIYTHVSPLVTWVNPRSLKSLI